MVEYWANLLTRIALGEPLQLLQPWKEDVLDNYKPVVCDIIQCLSAAFFNAAPRTGSGWALFTREDAVYQKFFLPLGEEAILSFYLRIQANPDDETFLFVDLDLYDGIQNNTITLAGFDEGDAVEFSNYKLVTIPLPKKVLDGKVHSLSFEFVLNDEDGDDLVQAAATDFVEGTFYEVDDVSLVVTRKAPGDIPALTLEDNGGTIAPGEQKEITLEVDPSELEEGSYGGNILAFGNSSVTPVGALPFGLTVGDVIPAADLEIKKRVEPETLTHGDRITFTIVMTNHGPATATNAGFVDNVPHPLLPVGTTEADSGGSCTPTQDFVNCEVASLAPGAAFRVTMVVSAPLQAGVFTNTVTASAMEPDPNPNNNESLATVAVPDSDGDGRLDYQENAGSGDANQDSQPDANQNNVVAWQDCPQSQAVCSTQFVAVADSGIFSFSLPLPIPTKQPADGTLLTYWKMLVRISNSQVVLHIRDTELLAATMPDAPAQPNLTYWVYGPEADNPEDHWFEFTYDGETGAELQEDASLLLHFVDGKRGDVDGLKNGEIALGGGPVIPGSSSSDSTIYLPTLLKEEEFCVAIRIKKVYVFTFLGAWSSEEGLPSFRHMPRHTPLNPTMPGV